MVVAWTAFLRGAAFPQREARALDSAKGGGLYGRHFGDRQSRAEQSCEGVGRRRVSIWTRSVKRGQKGVCCCKRRRTSSAGQVPSKDKSEASRTRIGPAVYWRPISPSLGTDQSAASLSGSAREAEWRHSSERQCRMLAAKSCSFETVCADGAPRSDYKSAGC